MKNIFLMATLIVALAVATGCTHGPVAPIDPVVHAQQVSSLIHSGTQTAFAFGMTAVPDQAEANLIATDAYNACNNEILPLLNGDPVALANGMKDLLALKAFDAPSLAKAKMVIEAAMPLVLSYIPSDVLSGQTSKIPDDVKSYLVAFFSGVKDGCSSYLGGVPPSPVVLKSLPKRGVDFKAMREKLAKK